MSKSKEELLKEWVKCKKAEKKQKDARALVEVELEKLYGTKFKGSSKTFKEEDLGFSVNVKKNIKTKLDQEAYTAVRETIPEILRPEIATIVYDLDVKGFEYLKANVKETYKIESDDDSEDIEVEIKDIYKKVSDCVEIKVNKPTIKVEKI